jgi:hypothetical protein
MLHGLYQQALGRLAGDDGRAAVAPLENRLTAVQTEPGRLLRRAVAFLAFFGKDRPDRRFEELRGEPRREILALGDAMTDPEQSSHRQEKDPSEHHRRARSQWK